MSNELKLKKPERTLLMELDQLIDWYEKFKPDAGKHLDVAATPQALAKAIGCLNREPSQRVYSYRGREIAATL